MKMKLTLAAILLAGPALAQMTMTDLDANTDAMIDMDEFGSADMTATYASYDADGDGMVTEDEFRMGEFSRYDMDADGMLNEEEYGMYEEDSTMMMDRDG